MSSKMSKCSYFIPRLSSERSKSELVNSSYFLVGLLVNITKSDSVYDYNTVNVSSSKANGCIQTYSTMSTGLGLVQCSQPEGADMTSPMVTRGH